MTIVVFVDYVLITMTENKEKAELIQRRTEMILHSAKCKNVPWIPPSVTVLDILPKLYHHVANYVECFKFANFKDN